MATTTDGRVVPTGGSGTAAALSRYTTSGPQLSPLVEQVKEVESQRDEFRDLCGEMIATFTLPANRDKFGGLGGEWERAVLSWTERFAKLGGVT